MFEYEYAVFEWGKREPERSVSEGMRRGAHYRAPRHEEFQWAQL